MNKRGFTLIELLATVTILIIIVSIALPSILSTKEKTVEKGEENVKQIITNAAETYIYTYNFDIDDVANNKKCVQISELVKRQLIKQNDSINLEHVIEVSKDETGKIIYLLKDNCASGQLLVYVEEEDPVLNPADPDPQIEYTDNSGANKPELVDGLIPVTYNGTNWVVADTSKQWYDYNAQWWANAVTTSSSTYRTAAAGTTIPISSINSMWVWIPRYKYRITFQTVGVNYAYNQYYYYNSTPGLIDIVFESGTSSTGKEYYEEYAYGGRNVSMLAINEYYTHPSFRDGSNVYKSRTYDLGGWDKELTGFWVGKFETSGTASLPTIIPGKASLRSQTADTQISTAKLFSTTSATYGLPSTSDSHMMKNTEWGAVAYLTQSKYGKAATDEEEVYPNVNSSYLTGYSTGRDSCDVYDGDRLSYNNNACCLDPDTTLTQYAYNTDNGYTASTTGNIYGIYDMNGGAAERVNAGTTAPRDKYREQYHEFEDDNLGTYQTRKLGDATYETKQWYKSRYVYTYDSFEYIIRGGSKSASWVWDGDILKNDINAGLFYWGTTDSSSSSKIGFRTVLIP